MYNIKEASKELSIPERTLREWLRRKVLKGEKNPISGRWFFADEEIQISPSFQGLRHQGGLSCAPPAYQYSELSGGISHIIELLIENAFLTCQLLSDTLLLGLIRLNDRLAVL